MTLDLTPKVQICLSRPKDVASVTALVGGVKVFRIGQRSCASDKYTIDKVRNAFRTFTPKSQEALDALAAVVL